MNEVVDFTLDLKQTLLSRMVESVVHLRFLLKISAMYSLKNGKEYIN